MAALKTLLVDDVKNRSKSRVLTSVEPALDLGVPKTYPREARGARSCDSFGSSRNVQPTLLTLADAPAISPCAGGSTTTVNQ